MCNQRWTQKPKIPANVRLLFQWEEDSRSTPGMISVTGENSQAGRGDGECGLAPCDRHLRREAWVPSTQPQLDGTCASRIKGQLCLWCGHSRSLYQPELPCAGRPRTSSKVRGAIQRDKTWSSSLGALHRRAVPCTGNFSVPFHSPPALLLHPLLSQPPASLRKSHASPHGKRAGPFRQLSKVSGPFTGGTVVDAHIPGSSPVRLRPLPLQLRNTPQMLLLSKQNTV